MKAKEIMTKKVACCTPEYTAEEVSKLMSSNNCGCIPVVDSLVENRLLGVITDRDIVCRIVAKGNNPSKTKIKPFMTSSVVTVSPETSITDCCKKMEEHQIRRLLVRDPEGRCCGIIAQADIATHVSKPLSGELLREISEPSHTFAPMAV